MAVRVSGISGRDGPALDRNPPRGIIIGGKGREPATRSGVQPSKLRRVSFSGGHVRIRFAIRAAVLTVLVISGSGRLVGAQGPPPPPPARPAAPAPQIGPPRDPGRRPPTEPVGTSVIRGRVVAADTGNPIRRATVTLIPVPPPAPPPQTPPGAPPGISTSVSMTINGPGVQISNRPSEVRDHRRAGGVRVHRASGRQLSLERERRTVLRRLPRALRTARRSPAPRVRSTRARRSRSPTASRSRKR